MSEFGRILVPMVTPFDERGNVDMESAAQIMHYLVDSGCDGIVVAGTTGESATLHDDEMQALFELAVSEVGGRVDILAGTGSNDTAHAVELTSRAAKLDIDGHLIVTPYYNKPPRQGLLEHYRAVAGSTDKPIMLYNIPSRCGINLDPDLQCDLAEIANIVAVKQSNPDMDQVRRIVTETGLSLYCGDDSLFLSFLALGGKGIVAVSAHVAASQMKRVADLVEAGDMQEARVLDRELQDVYKTMVSNQAAIMAKAALSLLGLKAGNVRLPLVNATEAEVDTIKGMLERHGITKQVVA